MNEKAVANDRALIGLILSRIVLLLCLLLFFQPGFDDFLETRLLPFVKNDYDTNVFRKDVVVESDGSTSVSFIVATTPTKADIYINEKFVGVSPLAFIIKCQLDSEIKVEFVKNRYKDYSEKVRCNRNAVFKFTQTLKKQKKHKRKR